MADINRLTLIGNVGKEPEIKTLPSGKSVCNFSVATNESWKDKNTNEWQKITEWTNVTVYNEHSIRYIEKTITKGTRIYIEGMKKTRKWDDQDGVTHYATDLVISGYDGKVIMLDKGIPKENDFDTPTTAPAPTPPPAPPTENQFDDDIPW